MKTIGERIKTIRKLAGLNQKDLGIQLGVGSSAVSAYERNEKTANLGNMIKIANIGGVTLDWLITGQEANAAESGEIAATISPGDHNKSKMLMERRKIATSRNIHIRYIIEWMGQEFSEEDARALFFYEDLRAQYPSFDDFMEKKRPRSDHKAANSPMGKKAIS